LRWRCEGRDRLLVAHGCDANRLFLARACPLKVGVRRGGRRRFGASKALRCCGASATHSSWQERTTTRKELSGLNTEIVEDGRALSVRPSAARVRGRCRVVVETMKPGKPHKSVPPYNWATPFEPAGPGAPASCSGMIPY
jgi:hypothetical protein